MVHSRQTSEAKANDTQFRFQRLPNIYFTARNIIWVAQADENISRNILGQHRELIVQLSGAAFSKVPRKILGKLLILGATDTQVATSSRGYSATVEHCTNRPINSVQ